MIFANEPHWTRFQVIDYPLAPNNMWFFLSDMQKSNWRWKRAKLATDWNTEFHVGNLYCRGTCIIGRGLASLSQLSLLVNHRNKSLGSCDLLTNLFRDVAHTSDIVDVSTCWSVCQISSSSKLSSSIFSFLSVLLLYYVKLITSISFKEMVNNCHIKFYELQQ